MRAKCVWWLMWPSIPSVTFATTAITAVTLMLTLLRACDGRIPWSSFPRGSRLPCELAVSRIHFHLTARSQDRDERLPLHHACMNKGPVANYLVSELVQADADGANKYDRDGKLPVYRQLDDAYLH